MNMLYVIVLSVFLSCGLAYGCVNVTQLNETNHYNDEFYDDKIRNCNNDDKEYQEAVTRFTNESDNLTSIVGPILRETQNLTNAVGSILKHELKEQLVSI